MQYSMFPVRGSPDSIKHIEVQLVLMSNGYISFQDLTMVCRVPCQMRGKSRIAVEFQSRILSYKL